MSELIRSLSVLADGEPVNGFSRVRLSGGERLGLLPFLFTLRLWNLAEEGYLALSRCRSITVKCGEAELVSGQFADSVRTASKQGTITTVCFSPGLALWQSGVSLSVPTGLTAGETVERLLTASATGIDLLTAEGMGQVFVRPQAFRGRAAECIGEALSISGARACLVPSGLCVVPANGVPVSVVLGEEDLLAEPEFPSGDRALLRTRAAGWTLGKGVRAVRKGTEVAGLICERFFDLDTGDGPWRTEIVLQMKN